MNGDAPPLAAVLTYDAERARDGAHARSSASRGRRGAAQGDVTVALVGPGSFVRGVHLPNLRADSGVRIKTVVARRRHDRHRHRALAARRRRGGDRLARGGRGPRDRPRRDRHAPRQPRRDRRRRAARRPRGVRREAARAHARGDRRRLGGRARQRPARDRLQPAVRAARRSACAPRSTRRRARRTSSTASTRRSAADHWLNDPRVGGGRILGEACHMFDFANWLCGAPLRVMAAALPAPPAVGSVESASITIEYAQRLGRHRRLLRRRRRRDAQGARRGAARRALVGARRLPLADVLGRGRRARPRRRARTDKGHAALMRRVLAACRGERAVRARPRGGLRGAERGAVARSSRSPRRARSR